MGEVNPPPRAGLSPRGRGNPTATRTNGRRCRSIPAWTGEPTRTQKATSCKSSRVYPRVDGGTHLRRIVAPPDVGSIPAWTGEPGMINRDMPTSGSIPAWTGEPPFGKYYRRCNILGADVNPLSSLSQALMVFHQVNPVCVHNLLRRFPQRTDLLFAHGRRVTPGHHYRSLAQLVVPLRQNVPYPLPYPSGHVGRGIHPRGYFQHH